ncbi:MAG: class I SAM-dependent methyltransferase [Acidobacteriota bacterium]|nr:class I SAM-dependent methyltransferase [Acidobacteriota bacterium]
MLHPIAPSPAVPDACGPIEGQLVITPATPASAARARTTWTAGEFGRIAVGYADGAAAFVDRIGPGAAHTVLDVACGTGNLALPAARRGAIVTGLDIAPNLLEVARAAATADGLPIRFDEGNAEEMPYADRSFDVVMSMFGVMFVGRPDRAVDELVRVARQGGRIALASWTPTGFIGSMLRAHVAAVPPPAGAPSPLAWGVEEVMCERLAPHASRIRDLHFVRRTIWLAYPLTPAGIVDLFRKYYGPTVRAFAGLDESGQASLTAELEGLWTTHAVSRRGLTGVDAEYLEVYVDMA